MIELEFERDQIMSRVQPDDAAHVPSPRIQGGKAKHVRCGQRTAWFSKRFADGRIEPWIRDEHFLSLNGGCYHRQKASQQKRSGEFNCFHLINSVKRESRE